MTRHRSCTFTDTVLLTLNFTAERQNTGILNYFSLKKRTPPSKSAFTQQRKKFTSDFFPHLLDATNEAFPFKKTYKGHPLIAVDGSDINLTTDKNDKIYCVKQARSDAQYYQMHLNAMYDICENRYISAIIQPCPQMNEHLAFRQLVSDSHCPENSIFIADRGYVSYNTLAFLLENNRFFLIRAKTPGSN